MIIRLHRRMNAGSSVRRRRLRHSGGRLGAILLCAAIGCEPAAAPGPGRQEDVKVLFIAASRDEPTWAVVQSTAAQFSARHPRASVDVTAPPVRSPKGQQDLLAAAAKDRACSAVCIMPTDPLAVRDQISRLNESGIPVVTVGRDVPGALRGAYCGPSETMLGRSLAEACGQVLKDRTRTVMLLRTAEDDPIYSTRYHGFKTAAPMAGPLDVLREVDGRRDPQESARRVRTETRRFPRIGCWAFLDDWPLRSLGPNEDLLPLGVTICICGAEPALWPRVRTGAIQAMVGYDIQEAVEEAMFRAVRLARDEAGNLPPERLISTEIFMQRDLPRLEARWEAWTRGEPSASAPSRPMDESPAAGTGGDEPSRR